MAIRSDYIVKVGKLRYQDVNLISAPLTWGFPSPTALVGFGEALSRWTRRELDVRVTGIGVVCHAFDAQVASSPFAHALRLRRDPLTVENGKVKPAALLEEGRSQLEVSFVIGFEGGEPDSWAPVAERLATQRFAGGPCVSTEAPRIERADVVADGSEERQLRRFLRRLLPGFALVSREDLFRERLEATPPTVATDRPTDALLAAGRLEYRCAPDPGDPTRGEWTTHRAYPGWAVPLCVGYRGISKLYAPGEMKGTRDPSIPARFVEGIYSVGQWVAPHRVRRPEHLLWEQTYEPAQAVYRCSTPGFVKSVMTERKED